MEKLTLPNGNFPLSRSLRAWTLRDQRDVDGRLYALKKGRSFDSHNLRSRRKKRRYMHGAFYLGSTDFYQWLRELKDEDYEGLSMTRVSKVNDLYDAHEWALRRQRKNARFFNTCMNVTLMAAPPLKPSRTAGSSVVLGVNTTLYRWPMNYRMHIRFLCCEVPA